MTFMWLKKDLGSIFEGEYYLYKTNIMCIFVQESI